MVEIAPGRQANVDRGPDWLFIKLPALSDVPVDSPPLAESLWSTLERHFTYRVVIEMDQVGDLQSKVVGQLVNLQKRVHTQGGVVRLCGLSPGNQEILRNCNLDSRFPAYRTREEAVHGYRAPRPR